MPPAVFETSIHGLPPGMQMLERGWLSANNLLFLPLADEGAAVVDTGYVSHAAQTVALLEEALQDQPLARILNTHLHSDHCGGNAALQARWKNVQTAIAPGQAAWVRDWDPVALGYVPTGQSCPQFAVHGLLESGHTVRLSGRDWQIHAAPGHDPHSIILFEPQARVLISADALWENGFGVVFPEIEGVHAFDAVAATLNVIEQLKPALVVPGHGSLFSDVPTALAVARRRLQGFVQAPERHARYAAKVLLKYKLLEWQSIAWPQLLEWVQATSYLGLLHQSHGQGLTQDEWLRDLLAELERSGAAQCERDAHGLITLHNR